MSGNRNEFDLRATDEELERYEADGYFVREAVFDETELEPLRDAVDEIHRKVVKAAADPDADEPDLIDGKRYQKLLGSSVQWEWEEGNGELRTMEPYQHLDPRLDALIDDVRLWGPSRDIVRSDELSLFSDKLNFKSPGGCPFPWHQDSPYWAFLCDHLDRLVSVATILDRSTLDNGCLWMIPGSHKHGALKCFEDRGVVGRLYTDVEGLELEEPAPIEGPGGTVVFFHGDIVHGSRGNRTEQARRMLLHTYQPAGFKRWQQEDIRPIVS
jgi:phytanoyl-CoA hydroxylase